VNSLWTSKQDPVSGIVSTILQDMSADGNCISAELDQFLSEPLISHQDDPASWWNMNMLCCTEIPGTTTYRIPSERLFSTADDIISD